MQDKRRDATQLEGRDREVLFSGTCENQGSEKKKKVFFPYQGEKEALVTGEKGHWQVSSY